jgi:hypothetical protein
MKQPRPGSRSTQGPESTPCSSTIRRARCDDVTAESSTGVTAERCYQMLQRFPEAQGEVSPAARFTVTRASTVTSTCLRATRARSSLSTLLHFRRPRARLVGRNPCQSRHFNTVRRTQHLPAAATQDADRVQCHSAATASAAPAPRGPGSAWATRNLPVRQTQIP